MLCTTGGKLPGQGRVRLLQRSIVHAETDQILGFTLLCTEAQELINLVAMDTEITFRQLTDWIYTHPSMTEAFNYFDYFGSSLI